MKKIFYGSAIQGAKDRAARAHINRGIIEFIKRLGFSVVFEHTCGRTIEETAALLEKNHRAASTGGDWANYLCAEKDHWSARRGYCRRHLWSFNAGSGHWYRIDSRVFTTENALVWDSHPVAIPEKFLAQQIILDGSGHYKWGSPWVNFERLQRPWWS